MSIFIPYLHIIAIMVLMGSLISEHLILKPEMNPKQIKSLATLDFIYGMAAVLVLITGLLRWFVYGRGAAYYLSNPLFHTKLTLFVIMAILSVFPTIKFLKWRKEVNSGTAPGVDEKSVKRLLMLIRIEILIVVIIPFLAVMIARGYGV
jgi:putative membrane protein